MVSLKIASGSAETAELDVWGKIASGVPEPMETRGKEVWQSPDEKVGTGIWECDAGTFTARFADRGEFITVVSGSMTCTAEDGTVTELGPGDSMTFPQGWTGTWELHSTLRKIYCEFKGE
jgi:uncharacterized cupin superfamily protein